MQNITVADVEQTAISFAQHWMSYDEPIPDYKTRFSGILESCVATPFQSFGGRTFYRGLISKASVLFYLMIKNHPFLNGNKRIAIATLLVFLFLNGRWLRAELDGFYDFAMRVAESKPEHKDAVVSEIKKFIKKHIVAIPSVT